MDVTRVNRVLLNLIGNAYKFTPSGGSVTVTLRELAGVDPFSSTYELSVRDTGIGMSEEFAAKVFDAFERERTSTASGIQGTGLGMAITKRIVDLMGGTIEVDSEQGRGTEFIVRVAFAVLEDQPAADAGTDAGDAPEPIDFEGMRLLLAEDNEINREIAGVVLEELGFVVDMVEDGQQALDKLVAAGPGVYDVVVTDIQMPVMNGLDEARAIRALPDPALAGIPIVAMSANAFREDIEASRAAGIDAHVAKPIDIGEVIDALTLAIGSAR
jgi:CheY-like chemotaxis protein/anti-sigma regulatory factor (Ser/Thr protein kinase)